METDARLAWLRLVHGAGLSRQAVRRLLKAFGEPQEVWAAGTPAWQAHLTTRQWAATSQALAEPRGVWAERERAFLNWLDGPSPVPRQLITLADSAYPAALLNSSDPPLLLFTQGRLAGLAQPSLAVIGSRRASPQGRQHAHDWSHQLVSQGWTVVSGLAHGIDAAAHEGALAACTGGQDAAALGASAARGGAATIAVVATGLDQVYPRQHMGLAERIQTQGLMVSEYPPGSPPLAERFPERNRIIAGLTRGTLVVEAALKSGSLITARLAMEAGREVWAIPGSIHVSQHQGCHALIQQGAALVTSVKDILQDLPDLGIPSASTPSPADINADVNVEDASRPLTDDWAPAHRTIVTLDAPSQEILSTLGGEAMTVDNLSAHTGREARELAWALLELELQGHVRSLPGGLWQRLFRV